MTINAKEILKNKFWIVESNDKKLGTLSLSEDKKYMLSDASGTRFFSNINQLNKNLGAEITWTSEQKAKTQETKEVYNYPTSCIPHNPIFDVQRNLALFTKSSKSKSLYCAGYFIIHFEKGWVKSFCPKLITVERYETQGPFKTEIEMRQELSSANR